MFEKTDRNQTRKKLVSLFKAQKRTLECFLERGAITKAQYGKSLFDLIETMGNDGDRRGNNA